MTFGVLVFPDVEELDFVGPWDLLGLWSKVGGGPERRVIVAQTTAPVVCANGLIVQPHVGFEDCPTLDFLLVPGGLGTRREVENLLLIDFIRERAKTCHSVLSVCTGAFLLHRAGLLAGRSAATHWNSLDRLRALGDVTVIEERFVRDGNVWTSAGISAGIDMTLAFIAGYAGEDLAGKVQFGSEYYPSGVRYGEAHRHPGFPAYARPRS